MQLLFFFICVYNKHIANKNLKTKFQKYKTQAILEETKLIKNKIQASKSVKIIYIHNRGWMNIFLIIDEILID